jgi:hypothetical protein
MSQVIEEMCQERHKNLTKEVNNIQDNVMKILLLWNGNGKPGVGYKVDTMWEYYCNNKRSTQGIIDWAFRAVITILITYIAVRMGLQ